MNKNNAKALSTLRQKIRKYNRDFESHITNYKQVGMLTADFFNRGDSDAVTETKKPLHMGGVTGGGIMTQLWGGGLGGGGGWQASFITSSFPFFKNPELSADEDAEKNEEDSEGEGGDPRCRWGGGPKLGHPSPCFLGCPAALPFTLPALVSHLSHQALPMRMRMRMESVLPLS